LLQLVCFTGAGVGATFLIAAVFQLSAAEQTNENSSPMTAVPSKTLAERIVEYCEQKGYQLSKGSGEKNIIYVEGMYPNGQLNENEFNVWNDSRLVIEFKNGEPVIIGAWEATTNPGAYYTNNPMNPKGVAILAFGQYTAWQVGIHYGYGADPHEALVQAGAEVTLHRDANKDGIRTGDLTDTGFFDINQTWGYDLPANNINFGSAGNLVGRTRQGHQEFMALCKQDPRYLKNRAFVFSTTIIEGRKLFYGND
jgi:hypothetical protein